MQSATPHQTATACDGQVTLLQGVNVLFLASGAPALTAILDGLAPELAPGTLLADNLSALLRYDAFCAGYIGLGESAWLVGTAAVFLALNTWTIRNIRD